MKMIKQTLTGLAVLVLAIAIVDCNANLQQVLEQQASNLAAATKDIPKVRCTDEAPSVVAAASKAAGRDSVSKDNEPADKSSTEPNVGVQVDEKEESVSQELIESTRQQRQSSKTSKTNKYKVITISIPEDSSADVVVVDSSRDEKQKKQDDQSPSVEEDKPVESKANPTSEEAPKLPAEGSKPEEQQQPAKGENQEEKPAKKQDFKSKSDKKTKSKSMKRDKRETKKSGSSKNSKTKRSAEKSKKYEGKKKSKK